MDVNYVPSLLPSCFKCKTLGDRSSVFPDNHDEDWADETTGTHGILEKVWIDKTFENKPNSSSFPPHWYTAKDSI